ncbi:MAG: DNA-directed RNA polymerase subunit A' [Nitrososphaerota archaeon]|nr:DNA-directed RNA polymerase subunit A' [Nitrososphaerota archaeon]MDG6912667.1 DNA-directed RNA polymerase subunit A' [Nitrososphaerota archaeon]MDG6937307.1 DNA-directed RNA polymerase subunit A' [Nitrososphaerota archaeon]MDG6961333.1 DNA-directed RNA polymerase subunit A' [Nitrososphaerota archaeon]MDG6984896.1 DNA-directed RNA polymerase subunit A' [Nitrososphaerota archaeon]
MSMEQALKTIGGINFAVFSPAEVRKYSVAEITQPETYDEDGMPVQGGLMDSRLGTLEPGQKCGTCGGTAGRCPGHFGHVELAEPVLHIAFVDEINRLVQTTCRSCGRILLPQQELDAYQTKLTSQTDYTPSLVAAVAKEIITKAKKVKLCPHCGKQQYQIEFTKPTIFHEITEEGGATRLLPVAIRERLERINNDDLGLLGFNSKAARPEWFVLQVLQVPPLTVRPSITLESGIRSEDDLTHKVVDILRVNQRVRESKESGTPHLIVQDLVDLLHYHVTTYFDNEVSGIPQAHHRSGRPLKTLSQRLKGKEGRFRGSLSGKRVDFSSRTVISPDPNLDIGEVGVPFEVAKKLTIPEKVSPFNINHLKDLVNRGPFEHPGANYVIRPDGVKIRLDFASDRKALADSLTPGYIVERHLMDGDIVLFNRQPSLHRMSVMAHFVRVLPFRTFRLHPSVCPPYNADFDGDEMNLHVPQSEESRSEALMLMRVQDQILSPRYGGPIIGGIRDFITGAFMLTRDEAALTPAEFSNLALVGDYVGDLPEPAVKGTHPTYTGKQLFSLFLPKGMNYVLTSKWAKAQRTGATNDVVIRDGELISGVVDKAVIGAEEPDSLLHRIAKDYGNEEARNFLNSILKVLKTFLTRRGFTYGFNELELPTEAKQGITDALDEAYASVTDLQKKYKTGSLQLTRGLSAEDTLEAYIVNELAKARDKAGRIADKAFPAENSGMIMARTGARGSSLNVGQMTAALGQQSVRGKRISHGLKGRALSHFAWNDPSPTAKGFVKSNYRDGLSPTEFFFHAMGGREGLVDTAVRTQQSGYMQRRLVNALEHLKVEYDLTVRDPHGHVIQFLYGEDGVDPAKSDHGRPINLDRLIETEELSRKSKAKTSEEGLETLLKKYQSSLNERLVKELRDKLGDSHLTDEGLKESMERVAEALDYSRVEPGEASGIVAAQSIGEPGTQMTLRTFHFAGVRERDVTLGLPRLMELVDARKIPAKPSMDIYLTKDYAAQNEKAVKVAKEILFTKVGNVVAFSEVDPTEGIKLHLNPEMMADRDTNPEEIAKVIETGKRKVQQDKKNANIIHVSMPDADLSALFTLRNKILNMKLKGIPGITRVTVVKEGEEWFIQTSGSNLGKVVQVQGVDPSKVYTNNVHEVAQVLGIEAARATLVRELMSTLDEQGLEVDIRHIFLVADLMTSKGYIQQIGRHGIAGTKSSVLARAAFEITVPTLAEAAVKGEVEDLKGVTENVIVGLPIPVGTGMIDLYMS